MESREQNQSSTPGTSRRPSSPPLEEKKDEFDDTSLRVPRRVSFNDERGAKDDPEMRVFRMRVYYSEATIDGALKTYPQTKVATVVSPLLANRSNFVNSIRKKLTAYGVSPHTPLTLTPVPRVPNDRDYSIAHWLKKYPGAAMVVSPEDEKDSVYRQLVTLKGQPPTRNTLNQPEPDSSPIDGSSPISARSPSQFLVDTERSSTTEGGDSGANRPSVILAESASPEPIATVIGHKDNVTTTPGSGDGSPATPNSGESSPVGTTTILDIVRTHRRELGMLEEKLIEATSQLMLLEEEHASKDLTIHLLEEKLQNCNQRMDEVEEALEFSETQSYQARLREAYRRMFLECVRKRVRAKLRAWFKFPPSPVDYLLVSYDKVLLTCEEMEDLESHVGLTLQDLKLTEEDPSTSRPGIHANERIHIGVYAEMAHSQAPEHLPAYRNLFFFLYNQEPQTVMDNLIDSWT